MSWARAMGFVLAWQHLVPGVLFASTTMLSKCLKQFD